MPQNLLERNFLTHDVLQLSIQPCTIIAYFCEERHPVISKVRLSFADVETNFSSSLKQKRAEGDVFAIPFSFFSSFFLVKIGEKLHSV